jgi:transposase
VTEAEDLLQYSHGKACIADTGYDSDRVIEVARARGMRVVIPSNPTARKKKRRIDRALYRLRAQVECFFHRLKRFRAIATRYEKTATNFLALVHIACIRMWLA